MNRLSTTPALLAIAIAATALAACANPGDHSRSFGGAGSRAEADSFAHAGTCLEPAEGCPCAGNQPPVACSPDEPPDEPPAARPGEPELCYEGTRACERGLFGACEGVRAYRKPDPSQTALVDQFSDHPSCSDCDPNCYRVVDSFNPDDGALDGYGDGLSFHSSGAGVTLTANLQPSDAGMPDDASVPDGSIVLPLQDGLTATGVYRSLHRPQQADVYFLVDQSLSMAEETLWLYDSFAAGGGLVGAGVACTDGDQSLADAGIGGAIQCMVRDAAFGTGMLRDIPFDPYATDTTLPVAARDADARAEIAYRNHADMSLDPAVVPVGMGEFGGLQSSGDPDTAGSQIPALYSIATGAGQFMGLARTAVPDAVDCPAGTSGYPCFRDGSDAIVVLLTDAPMHNGPDAATLPYDYDSADLGIQVGTSSTATTIPGTNDDFDAPYSLSEDAANELSVFLGSTATLSPSVAASAVSCGADDAANDATFMFTVAPGAGTPTIELSAQGTAFGAALAVFDGPVASTEVLPAADDDNELFTNAYALGDVSGRGVVVGGDTTDATSTTDMGADYQGSLFGTCGANSVAPDAVFSLDVSGAAAPLALQVTLDMQGDYPVLAIYEEGAGPLPRWPAQIAPLAASGNTNALAASVFDIPSGTGNEYLTVTGNTMSLASDYDAAELGGAACNPDSASKDAGFHISVNGTRSLRFDTEGSSFDTVLSLHRRPPLTKDGDTLAWAAADTHQNLNEDAQTAYETGPVDGLTQVFSGDTSGMSADIGDTFGCGMDSGCGDAVYKVQVLESTTVRIEVAGTGFDPAVVITRADPAGVSGRYPPFALGERHGCALSDAQVYCWGADDLGQIGDGGSPGDADIADATLVTGLTDVLNVCAGKDHNCTVNASGQVHCWGEGSAGQLGDGNATDAFSAVQATGIGDGDTLGRAVQVACGDAHSCALLEDGRVACWGEDADGQLGDGTPGADGAAPTLVTTAERFEQLAAGGAHTCAIRSSDNAVFCWGDGGSGQLGNAASSDSATPVQASGLVGATHIMTGAQHTCAPLSSGRVMCWGRGTEGQLGQGSGDTGNYDVPVAVLNLDGSGLLANVKGGFAAGTAHSCVTSLEGFVRCWGDNGSRQMGNDDSSASAPLPIIVFEILDALTVVSGYDHSCALRADGTLYCWGAGGDYRLGDGMTSNPSRPVRAHSDATNAVDFGSGTLDAAFTNDCRSVARPPEAGCNYGSLDGRSYFFCNDQLRTFAGAGQACEAVGLQLVDVDTAGENDFIASGVADRSWIGVKRASSDDWSELEDNLDFEDLDGNTLWTTTRVGQESCNWLGRNCRWIPTEGYFSPEAAPDLRDSQPYNSQSTWSGNDQPSPDWGNNCVTVDTNAKWETDQCTSVEEPASRDCGFLGLGCLFSFLGDLFGGLLDGFLGDLLDAIFGSLGGVYVAPYFSGGVERGYVCEERERFTEITLDPGTYFVTVKGVDDGVASNACEGPYDLAITDIGAPGGGFVACDDNGVAETRSSVIEASLTDGDYYLVLKGKGATDAGEYRLTVRDVGAVDTTELACDAGTGVGDPARVTFSADPTKSYYALVKGDAPLDKGAYTLRISDPAAGDGTLIACDADSGPDGDADLSLDLAAGTYYAVLKGTGAGASGDYRLTVGGAAPGSGVYVPPTYDETVDALNAAGIRVASVVSCAGSARCDDAQAQASALATDTAGVTRAAATAADVPAEVVKSIELLETLDSVSAQLLFMPDANPGFVSGGVAPVPDPGNLCTTGATGFTDCSPGATPAFAVSIQDPALITIPPSGGAAGAYQFTLRVTGLRNGQVELLDDIPVYVLPAASPSAGTFTSGRYYQDFDSRGCDSDNQRPSWDELLFDADVRPDTRVVFSACSARDSGQLADCDGGGDSGGDGVGDSGGDSGESNQVRVLTVTAGTGSGTPCSAATQDADCPGGYCSPYTGICNYLEGKSCTADIECAGGEDGRCREGPSFAEIGKTCRVQNNSGTPGSALGSRNYEPYMRITLDLESLGDGSKTPSVFFWETWYRCRDVE